MSAAVAARRQTSGVAILAVSVLAHGLALALLGLTHATPREAALIPPPAIDLDFWPSPPAARKVRAAASSAIAPPAPTPRPARPDAPPSAIPALPLAPLTGRPAPAAAGPVAPSGRIGGDVRQALRGSMVGCANRDAVGLTLREREACDEAVGRRSASAADIAAPIDPAKRAAWDAVAARKAAIRRRKEGAVPPGIDPTNNAGGTRTNGIGLLGY